MNVIIIMVFSSNRNRLPWSCNHPNTNVTDPSSFEVRSQAKTYHFVPAALASCTFQITLEDRDQNINTVSKPLDPKDKSVRLLRSKSCPNISEHQLPGCVISCLTIFNLQQIKKYFVRILKPSYLNQPIYNIQTRVYRYKMCFCYMSLEHVLIMF